MKFDPSSGRSDDLHVAHAFTGHGYTQVFENLDAPWSNQVATGLVTRKGSFVNQSHPRTRPGQDQGGHAPSGPGPYNQRIKPACGHYAHLGRVQRWLAQRGLAPDEGGADAGS
jgi:hypothetical protein